MAYHSCRFNGQCEKDELGEFSSLEECELKCQEIDFPPDLLYLTFGFDFESALKLSPSDASKVVSRETGISLYSVNQAKSLINDILRKDYCSILENAVYPVEFRQRRKYLESVVDPFIILLIDILSDLECRPYNWETVSEIVKEQTLNIFQDKRGSLSLGNSFLFEDLRPTEEEFWTWLRGLIVGRAFGRLYSGEEEERDLVERALSDNWDRFISFFPRPVYLDRLERIWRGEEQWS